MKDLTQTLHYLLREAAQSGDWSNIPQCLQTPKFGMMVLDSGENCLMIATNARQAHRIPKSMYPPRLAWVLEWSAEEDQKRADLHTLGIPSPEL